MRPAAALILRSLSDPDFSMQNLRLGLIALAALLLAACAGQARRDCQALAGTSWSLLSRPPQNSANLLALVGMPDDSGALWYARGDNQLLACMYARGLTSPGCGGATVYQFGRRGERWQSQGTAMDACDQ